MSIRAASAFALFALCPPVSAEDSILFLGNSFTIGGTASVPTIFDRLAIAGGHEDPTTVMRAVGGQDFRFHETDATSQAQIVSRPWTHVVIQNYSTQPTHIGNPADHHAWGKLLYERILANNPDTKVVLYQTWARAANHPLISGTSTATTFASTAEMQAELRANYAELADTLNSTYPDNPPVAIAPVGDAWENAGGLMAEAHPDFTDLHGGDNYHGNNNGYYLAAAVIYATIYGKSPEGLYVHPVVSSLNLNLTEDSEYLERVAWDTVAGNVQIEFLSHPESRQVAENQPVSFTVEVRGSPPYSVQWFRDGEEIEGANGLTYDIPSATAEMDGAVFTVEVSNDISSPVSDPAVLTVVPDIDPPSPADVTLISPTAIEIAFGEPLAPGPAADPANFTVVFQGRRIPVISSALSANGGTVTLALGAAITGGFVVGIGPAVGDLAGNAITGGAVVASPSPAGPSGQRLFIDFGANDTPTGTANDPDNSWNNVGTSIGSSNTAVLDPLVGSNGIPTGMRLEMVRRFNGANTNGTQAASAFPASATRDTLYGNTEVFGGLADIFPSFRLAGLDPLTTYTLTFYASRMSVSDNRETLYTVTGEDITTTTLNPANNIENSATLAGLIPSADGTLTVALSPTDQNTNSNHFTYLGALVIEAAASGPAWFHPPAVVEGRIVLDWEGAGRLEASPDLQEPWMEITPAPSPPYFEPLEMPSRFFRLSFPEP